MVLLRLEMTGLKNMLTLKRRLPVVRSTIVQRVILRLDQSETSNYRNA